MHETKMKLRAELAQQIRAEIERKAKVEIFNTILDELNKECAKGNPAYYAVSIVRRIADELEGRVKCANI